MKSSNLPPNFLYWNKIIEERPFLSKANSIEKQTEKDFIINFSIYPF